MRFDQSAAVDAADIFYAILLCCVMSKRAALRRKRVLPLCFIKGELQYFGMYSKYSHLLVYLTISRSDIFQMQYCALNNVD